MGLNSNNQLKFDEGKTTEPLTIEKASIEELEFGSKYVVHIKPTIEGYTHFLPSPGLEKKIKEENVDIGDVITIEKVEKSEKYPYGYFSINVVSKSNHGATPIHKSVEKFEQQFEKPDDKLELHELKNRIENVENAIAVIKKELENKATIPF